MIPLIFNKGESDKFFKDNSFKKGFAMSAIVVKTKPTEKQKDEPEAAKVETQAEVINTEAKLDTDR